ncbi:UNVERIFIED_CONTAM: hypothetical protein Slati_4165200 [Sesamum latifolium]|uniref:Uncharacterized protein n=1 Tax=Sesamum latifolium TaxID=2727402 RepID=A0AAW2T992_9LAMI
MRLTHNLRTCRCIPRWQGASSPRLSIMVLRMRPQYPSHVPCSLGASSAHAFVVAVFYASPE